MFAIPRNIHIFQNKAVWVRGHRWVHLPPSGVVPEPTDEVAEEKRIRTHLHAGGTGGTEWRSLGERGGGRGVQQASGSGLRRREDQAVTAQTPQSVLSASPRATPGLTCMRTRTLASEKITCAHDCSELSADTTPRSHCNVELRPCSSDYWHIETPFSSRVTWWGD